MNVPLNTQDIMVSGEIGSRLNLNLFFPVLNFRLHPVVAMLPYVFEPF